MLLTLILTPRPAAGYLDIRQAGRFEADGNYAAAASAYISAVTRLPWVPSLWEKAADACLKGKDYSHAEQYFETADRKHALSADGTLGWGDTALTLGNPKLAVNLWNGLIDKGGDPSVLLPRLARAYQALGFYSDEIKARKKYLAYRPGDAAFHYRLGLLYAATSPADALPELMRAVQVDPSLDASVENLRTALNTATLSDDRAYQLVVSGRALGTMGHWDLAAEAFRNAAAIRTDYAEAWAWLGEAKQQQDQSGSVEMEKALGLNPGSAMIQGLYGLYLQQQEQPKLALAAFQKAAALEPEDPGWQMALGEAYEQTGDLIAALEHFQLAITLSPGEATFWRALAEFSLRNNVDPAGVGLPAAKKLLELTGSDWQSEDIDGQILLETGDTAGAEAALKKASELGPTQAAPFLHLGLLYLQTGESAQAYTYLKQAMAFDPNGSIGWQAKRLLEQYFP